MLINQTRKRYNSYRIQGFTLLELVLVITIISVLGVVLIERLLRYREMAEKAAMEQVAGIIRSAMILRVSALLVRHQFNRIEQMPRENPMGFLAEKPSNYLGEYYNPDPSELSLESWYYDLHSRELVYLVGQGQYFIPDVDGRKWIRFRVELVYSDIEKKLDPSGGSANKEIAGVVLNLVQPYQWF